MIEQTYSLRLALASDAPVLKGLIQRSAKALSVGF